MSVVAMLNRLVRPFHGPKSTGRALQLRLDTARLYNLLPSLAVPLESSEQEADIAAALNLPSLPPFAHQAQAVRRYTKTQTTRALSVVRKSLIVPDQRVVLHDVLSFFPFVADSTVPNAGRGLFIDGHSAPGDLVGIYPGASFLPSQLRVAQQTGGAVLSDYAIARYDGVVIDGAADIELSLADALPSDFDRDRLPPDVQHPFAHAHLVNHPPPGTEPNVLQFQLDIDLRTLPRSLATLVPVHVSKIPVSHVEGMENLAVRQRVPGVENFLARAVGPFVVRTIGLFATRAIEDEEVFMDYRFNPDVALPDWYAASDGDGAARRWVQRPFFQLFR